MLRVIGHHPLEYNRCGSCTSRPQAQSPIVASSPPAFLDDDLESGPLFRRRAHTFSHPPVRKRISFESQPANHTKQAPLRRQHSVNPELLQTR
ncbi:hypothetical protein XENOCAPTIV_017016 [Xenoophorus captivus]|uniref:Uncharacterized protein n=1 Tax=Xenoophorus captivus TaxID=1517983 RepID=A0ABV0QSA1_9TELE